MTAGSVLAVPSGDVAVGGARRDPVFVLCMGRSGSTLLRFLLDAHPELACPPETNLPALCAQLSVVWSLIAGAPLAFERDAPPPKVPDEALAGIRRMLAEMTGSYLSRRGKRVLCEKSLGTARYADLLVQVLPEARFLCLYRHPMDVIRSGLDACPFGLTGYGFDQYIAGSPGNAVLALARFWIDSATQILAAEEAYPDRCYRVRYEDLVEDPESVMSKVYAFIGVDAAPGVAQACFSGERERFGPADHKIWATSAISVDSVGRGEKVPAGLIPPPVAEQMNQLAARLGYRPVDGAWGTPGVPADPRLPDTAGEAADGAVAGAEAVPGSAVLLEFVRSRVAAADERFASQWESHAREKFTLVSRAVAHGGAAEAQWLVDLAARTVTVDDGEDEDVGWSVLAGAQTWDAVVGGQLNLQEALRRSELRYCTPGDDSQMISQIRMAMLADLLGLGSWGRADMVAEDRASVAAATP